MNAYLDFEKPVADLQGKIEELRRIQADGGSANIASEIAALEAKSAQALKDLYAKLTPWQKTQVARHPSRPHALDYVAGLIEDYTPLAGDRAYAEDRAVIGGLGRFRGRSVVVIGHEKGKDTKSRLTHNFGMAMPEGYRKAIRLMNLAERFRLPVVTLVDTAGAFPGSASEERGIAEAIARSTEKCLDLSVPLISVVIGEGGSGGAVAIATGNVVMMLEHSVYSVISPEGCASILWRSSEKAADAANAMRITAQDLLAMKVIDRVIPEPVGGAHRGAEPTIAAVGEAIADAFARLEGRAPDQLKRDRREKFLKIGRSLAA